jgi:hypothetical protein
MSIRTSLKNKLLQDIKDINYYINKNRESIISLRNSDLNIEFITGKVIKVNEDISKKQETLSLLEKRLDDLENGYLDEEITNEMKNNSELVNSKSLETKNKKIKTRTEDKLQLNKFISKEKADRRFFKYEKKEADYSYRFFCKTIDKLPNHISENLKDMPNNKGYIFKGIHFFGKKQKDNSGLLTMFEKRYEEKDVLIIHEWSEREYKVFKKHGKNAKYLFSSVIRKRKI